MFAVFLIVSLVVVVRVMMTVVVVQLMVCDRRKHSLDEHVLSAFRSSHSHASALAIIKMCHSDKTLHRSESSLTKVFSSCAQRLSVKFNCLESNLLFERDKQSSHTLM